MLKTDPPPPGQGAIIVGRIGVSSDRDLSEHSKKQRLPMRIRLVAAAFLWSSLLFGAIAMFNHQFAGIPWAALAIAPTPLGAIITTIYKKKQGQILISL